MKKTHLRWILPLIVCVIAVGIAIMSYEQSVYDELVEAKEKEIALAVSEELTRIDVDISRAEAVVSSTGNIMSRFRMDDNRNHLVHMLQNILEESSANYAIVCDQNGIGFDANDKDVDISHERYFQELSSEYANGGSGMILPPDGQNNLGEVLLVYGAKFSSMTRGYLIAYLPIRTLDEQLFKEKFASDSQAIIALSGEILCSRGFENVTSGSNIIWDKIPKGLTKEAVKMAISQKNIYMNEVPDYGYAVLVPLYSAGGGALVLVKDSQMQNMIGSQMVSGNSFALFMVLISIAFVILVLIASKLGDFFQKRMLEKKQSGQELDVVTGLLSGEQTMKDIDSYTTVGADSGGMLFVIGTNLTSSEEDANVRGNDGLRDFARLLKSGFRSSDIIGRTGDGEFAVFLKGIREEKDIRKQTDEMQMFLHDVTSDSEGDGLTALAGAVLFPDGGHNARELMASARKALVRARQQGSGRLSF